MKIISNFTPDPKTKLGIGKLSARWVSSRGIMQVYLGGRYLSGVCGETEEKCYRELHALYDTDRKIDFEPLTNTIQILEKKLVEVMEQLREKEEECSELIELQIQKDEREAELRQQRKRCGELLTEYRVFLRRHLGTFNQ